jgi:hypothetical protein
MFILIDVLTTKQDIVKLLSTPPWESQGRPLFSKFDDFVVFCHQLSLSSGKIVVLPSVKI